MTDQSPQKGPTPKSRPKLWVTWAAKIMGGEMQCRWAAWYKTHFYYEKGESTGWNINNWTMEHNALLQERKTQLEALGMEVLLEDQNSFSVVGSTGIEVSGKPDIVAFTPDGEEFWVEDAKTGRPKTCDHAQVGIGMLLLPHTMPEKCRGKVARGNVIYKTAIVKVVPLDRQLFADTVAALGGKDPLPKTPSYGECRYCDIGSCEARIVDKPKESSCDWF